MKLFFLSLGFISVFFCSCKEASSASNSSLNQDGIEIFKDNTFQTGFALGPVDSKTVRVGGGHEKTFVDTLNFRKDSPKPVWRIAQWNSKFDLANTKPMDGPENSIYYENEGSSRKIALYPDHSLLLEVNASKEYDKPRIKGQSWPHLLIAQEFGNERPNIGNVNQLLFSMELKLERCENKMDSGTYNKSLHTAQSPLYFNIKNVNQNSADFNQMIRFGIPSYDYRYTKMSDKEKIGPETGHPNFIYNVPPLSVWGDISFQDEEWHKCEIDLKPLILRALEAIKEKDVFKNTSPDDLVITGMNFGWEVPGTFDATLKVKNLSLKIMK